MPPFQPVEALPAGDGPDALSEMILVCDHASNAVPPEIGDLGLGPADMARHIAWDVGARGVTLGLARALGAAAVLSTFSRLVIDPNRAEDDPTLVMRLYDGTIVPGNRGADAAEIARRITAYHRPYHRAIDAAIDAVLARGGHPALVSIHSFTPQFKGRAWRPWHVGLLWDRDDRLVRPLLARLEAEPDLVVGDNEPYTGQLVGDCMWRHGTNRDVAHLLIEIRNDLIRAPADQEAWATRLAPMLRDIYGARVAVERPALRPHLGRTAMQEEIMDQPLDNRQREALEAAVFRRLRDHLRQRTDVQNIDMMNLAGFCRNCLSRWYQEAAAEQGLELGKTEAREIVYGMPYEEWRARYQTEATPEQQAAFAGARPDDH